MKVYVLKLYNPQADSRLRVFTDRAKAASAARRWTHTSEEASASEWHGQGAREDYDAALSVVTVE